MAETLDYESSHLLNQPTAPPDNRALAQTTHAATLDTQSLSAANPAGPEPAVDRIALAAGTTVGQYELIRELGRGGMGVVYLARDTKLARQVAIKFLLTDCGTLSERFLTEARATARCQHENIVVIHDVAELRGQPYMVLEYLRGQTLRQLIGRGPLPAPRAVDLMVSVVRALDCAHRSGIAHRDLKPENIFVTASGTIKVLDFGIAKLLADHSGQPSPTQPLPAAGTPLRFTHTGTLIGTLPYMSPEQIRTASVDHRTDLWAAGVILFEMVLGKHPMDPLTASALLALADGEDAMPSAREHLPKSAELAAIIDRCLIADRDDRTASAADLLAELEAIAPGHRAAELRVDHNPFPGLAAFQESDAERFFGRSAEISRILTELRSQPRLMVVGPSGTGKSSLIRAGVIPALKRSGEGWTAAVLRPGRQPLAALADALMGVTGGTSDSGDSGRSPDRGRHDRPTRAQWLAQLRDSPGILGRELRAWAGRKRRRVVLFVDQLEELYTHSISDDDRTLFVRCLAGVADDASSPLRVIITIRSDFLERAIHNRGHGLDSSRGLVFVPPMSRDNLRLALTEPVVAAGHRFEEDGLVDTMLDALDDTPGALPLLQFAASKLWDGRDRRQHRLTRAGYESMGGVAGTLASHADAVLAGMAAARLRLARAVLERLVTPERTRALVTLGELAELPGDRDTLAAVVHVLADSRLVAIEDSSERDSATVELIHESLITRWPTLRRWLDENLDDAVFLARLRAASQ
ncbi:MAG: serine/threonine-protein kinase [Myxococcota bacterium]